MSRVRLTLACGSYDRTIPLQDGSVRPEGVDLNFIPMAPGELFRRQARHAEFDAAEFSLSTYCMLTSRGDDRLVAIPVFPSRKFRHSHVFVNRDRVSSPEDLRGGTIGSSEYQQTAAVWIRGMLADDYGVTSESVSWVLGGLNQPTAEKDRIPLSLPSSVSMRRLGPNECLNDLLEAGELDAAISAQVPDSLGRNGKVARLFEDSERVEKDYLRRTGIFPIMHIIVLRQDIHRRYPWIARNLYKAFAEAQRVGQERLTFGSTLYVSLPWLPDHLEELEALSDGGNLFGYGVPANRSVLETFLRFAQEQYLLERPLDVDELFLFEEA